MSIKVGDIDFANEVIELHYQLLRTQLLLEEILKINPAMERPTIDRARQIDDQAILILQRKFPNMGIVKKTS
jgi:hypothetical protein